MMIAPLFFLTLLIFLPAAVRCAIKRELPFFTVVSGAALTGVLSIAFILTLLTITSYSEIARALTSSYPMVLLFIIAVILDIITRISPLKNIQNNS